MGQPRTLLPGLSCVIDIACSRVCIQDPLCFTACGPPSGRVCLPSPVRTCATLPGRGLPRAPVQPPA
eukprot:4318298-Alexandrium_andersonii.AAC.1